MTWDLGDVDFILDEMRDSGERPGFHEGDRVRYVGDLTYLHYDGIVVDHPSCPPGKVAVRLRNGLVFCAPLADVRRLPDV